MLPQGDAKKVTIYLNQDTRAHIEPLWSAVLAYLRDRYGARHTKGRGKGVTTPTAGA